MGTKTENRLQLPDEVAFVLDQEAMHLYDDLSTAINDAINGEWSMRCDWLVERIGTLVAIGASVPPLRATTMRQQVYEKVGMLVGGRLRYEDANGD